VIDAVVRARMESSRLPRKTLAEVAGRPMIDHVLLRLDRARLIDRVVVAITDRPADDELADHLGAASVPVYRGSSDDVLDRTYRAAAEHDMQHVAHFGADNPLIDPALVDRIAQLYLDRAGELDYVTNNRPPTFPDGEEVEITSFALLERIWRETSEPRHREHLLLWAWEHPDQVRTHNVERAPSQHHERWTLDHPEDLELLTRVMVALAPGDPAFGIDAAIAWLDQHPEVRKLNAAHAGDYPWLEAAGRP
jgi:spore coat polysaccharide biosynthesis protein SpsF